MPYTLYLESGPKRRKTMVHVLDLLGCTAPGPTTEDALAATPDAIRAYLRFLLRHDEAVDPDAGFTTAIAEHVTQGNWLGYGDPTPGFSWDFQPLGADDLDRHLRRLAWLRADLLAVIGGLPPAQLLADPGDGSRSIYRIVEHMAESGCVYLRYLVGKVDGLAEALRAVQSDPAILPATLDRLWQISGARLAGLTEVERTQEVPHGQVTWTARRALRRTLEHEWEHFAELARRLGQPLT
jgi:predicted RNase H-like HicB family nuclease/uncharacterized damage-inducible protein DinB